MWTITRSGIKLLQKYNIYLSEPMHMISSELGRILLSIQSNSYDILVRAGCVQYRDSTGSYIIAYKQGE